MQRRFWIGALSMVGCAPEPEWRVRAAGQQVDRAGHGEGRALGRLAGGVGLADDGLPTDVDLRAAWVAAGIVEATAVFPPSAARRDPALFEELGLDRAVRLALSTGFESDGWHAVDGLTEIGPDPLGRAASMPDDPGFSLQWPIEGTGKVDGAVPGVTIGALAAWSVETGDGSAIIAVLDSGVNLTEPDLAGRIWQNAAEVPANGIDDDGNGYVDDTVGWDFVGDDADPDDDNGHGSSVAGLAAAAGDNGLGFAGVCWDCRVMALKDLDANAFGYVSDWAEALVYAADQGAHVANLSSVAEEPSEVLEDAVAYAVGVGMSVVAAAGNVDAEVALYPAAIADVLAVGASDGSDQRVTTSVGGSWGSSWGVHLDLLAPGVSMYGLDREDGVYGAARSGTSMSAPLVSGTLALLRTIDPLAPREALEAALLLGAADQVGGPDDLVGWDPHHGAGRLDVSAAVDALLRYGDKPPGMRLHCDSVAPGEDMTCVVDDVPGVVFTRFRLAEDEAPGTCPAELGGLCWDVIGPGARRDVLAGADLAAQTTAGVRETRPFGPMGVAQAVVALGDASEVSDVRTIVLSGCGDGLLQAGEACDDGDADDGDGCTSDCVATVGAGSVDVVGGGHHGCALDAAGAVSCWGLDDQAQCEAPAGSFVGLTAGRYHSCAWEADGEASCWGRALEGQLDAPPLTAVQLDAGWYHTCGVTPDGAAQCWGRDDDGESSAPEGFFAEVSAGYAFTCGRTMAGPAVCWGADDAGQLDAPGDALVAISAGGSHTCGLRAADGTVACWGWNEFGQATPPGGSFVAIASGHSHSCALDAAGAIVCWGRDFYDQLSVPIGTWAGLTAGRFHTCAWDAAGHRSCWGANTDGQAAPNCGDGVRQAPETCDDGNRNDGDGCNGRCTGA
jgi:cysteine-rich repeat protein